MDGNYIRQFKKGSLELILLALIGKKERYGYELITELNAKGAEVLGYAREGTVYPILYRLEAGGLIEHRLVPAPANGGNRKSYSLTPEGARTLEELKKLWRAYSVCVDGFIGDTEDEE